MSSCTTTQYTTPRGTSWLFTNRRVLPQILNYPSSLQRPRTETSLLTRGNDICLRVPVGLDDAGPPRHNQQHRQQATNHFWIELPTRVSARSMQSPPSPLQGYSTQNESHCSWASPPANKNRSRPIRRDVEHHLHPKTGSPLVFKLFRGSAAPCLTSWRSLVASSRCWLCGGYRILYHRASQGPHRVRQRGVLQFQLSNVHVLHPQLVCWPG